MTFPPPRFSPLDVEALVSKHFGMVLHAKPLASYRDANFLVHNDDQRFVFKIANRDEPREQLVAQHAVLKHLWNHLEGAVIPEVIASLNGDEIIEVIDQGGQLHLARMVSFIAGQFLGDMTEHSDKLLESVGNLMGRINHALRHFDSSQVPSRSLKWDLKNARQALPYLKWVEDENQRSLITHMFNQYHEWVEPKLPHLRQSLIHNDGNDFNLMVRNEGSETRAFGIIDFGDMVVSHTVNDLAISLAYAVLDKADPLQAATAVVKGFHQQFPLTENEIAVVFPLCCMRLAKSVCFSAEGKHRDPENEYLLISEKPAWRALERLSKIDPFWAQMLFREACGFEPNPYSNGLNMALQQLQAHVSPVIPLVGARHIDLGPGAEIPKNMNEALAQLAKLFQNDDPKIGYGGYLENRTCYTGDAFLSADGETRSIHLGLDVFAEAGTQVHCPLNAVVHGLFDHAFEFDYGPTVVLRHQELDQTFYTLYGHLSRNSLLNLQVGHSIPAGAPFATLGEMHENGGWVPHLHIQVFSHTLGHTTNLPGTCTPTQVNLWRSLCPNPLPLFGNQDARPERSLQTLIDRRITHLNPSLSLSYQQPLHIVKGSMQYLIDANSRVFLDAVNNVPHVGHCHPRIQDAQSQQAKSLVTNTRYLHEHILCFAENLKSLLPASLDTCYVVNSGSEANDLALRSAQSFTNRTGVVVIQAGYHGNLSSLIAISDYKFSGPGGRGKPANTFVLPLPDVYRGLFRGPEAAKAYIADMQERIRNWVEQGHQIGAVIVEPILGCGGQMPLPAGYLSALFKEIRALGGICIADEVQIGLGRLGSHMWGFQKHDAIPDIVTIGKPIGNGHPLAAVVSRREIAERFANGMEYFSTFGGNPVSCAIGNEVLNVLADEDLRGNAIKVGDELKRMLVTLMERHDCIGDVRGSGLFLGVELVRPGLREPDADLAAKVVEAMKAFQILLSRDGPQNNVIKIKPPMCFSEGNATMLADRLHQVLDRL